MHRTRFHTKHRKQRSNKDTVASSKPIPPGLAPLRAKLQEYFAEPSSEDYLPPQTHVYEGHSSSDVPEPQPQEIPSVYALRDPSEGLTGKPPLIPQYPLTKPRRQHIISSHKGIQLAPPFRLLVDPFLPFQPHHTAESSAPTILEYRENSHPTSHLINSPSPQSTLPDSIELLPENPRASNHGDTSTESGSSRFSDRTIHYVTRGSKVVEFDYSLPVKRNIPGIQVDNVVSLGRDVNYTGIVLTTPYFLTYAKSSPTLDPDPRLIYMRSYHGGFHTWLTLPATFGYAHQAYITDMAHSGDYLAVITNGGGALVWELPEPINQRNFLPTIRLQILPGSPGLKKVKWHSSGKIAFASSNRVYFLDLHEAEDSFCGLPVHLDKLKKVAKVFEVISPIASFAFHYKTNSIAILSFGGAICFFVIHGNYPIWKATIRGHGDPSSLDIYDWGMLIGWQQGSILQLFPPLSTNVISTLQFTNGVDLSTEIHKGSHTYHCYDNRLRVLWVSHSARSSLLAVRVPIEANNPRPESIHPNALQVFEQIVEIPAPSPITRVSLAVSHANELGDDMVKVYAVNASGVDCITITQMALEKAHSISNLIIGILPQEQPGITPLDISHQSLAINNPRPLERVESKEPSQPKIPAPHPVPVIRDPKKPGAHVLVHLKNFIELDVSVEWKYGKANTDCITITPLAQLKANSVSSMSPALLSFDHSRVPGPICTVDTFLAYGMTNGRIGLVFRHNGAHAQLKLPVIYGRNSSTIDLAIIGNYLACITDGGGAIVWNVPNTYSGRKGTSLKPLLQVQPSGLRKVKWHHGGKLALLSNSEVCLFDIHRYYATFEGFFVPWKNLMQLAERYEVPSSFIANFAFDVRNAALAAISVDSVLTLWSLDTQHVIWQGRIPGGGDPSSVELMDDIVIIGRNRGCTLQLLAPRSIDVLSTFQFVCPVDTTIQTSTQMYTHLRYDSRLRTLWVVNSNRSSLIALRVSIVPPDQDADIGEVHGAFEKIAEFPTPVPIEGLLTLVNGDTQRPLLAVATTVSQENRIDLLDIDQSTFEASLQTLSAKPPSKSNINPKGPQGVSPSLGGEELRRLLDPTTAYQYFEPEYQSPSPPPSLRPQRSSTNYDKPVDIAYPKEMSTEEMFDCLLNHGCLDLTEYMNPTTYSKGFIAGGAFGDIWKGELRDGTAVAIKVWRFRTLNEDPGKNIKRAMREIYNWSKLDHDNAHKLLGVIVFDGRLGMVSKWMENGNLQDYIRKNHCVDRYGLCIQIAQGVEYLHGKNMIHGDLKATNILVSSDNILKLADFDHSILSECTLQFSQTTRVGGGTLRWMAPELVLDSEAIHQRNKRTDIYALGMTFLETITGAVPYSQQCRTDINIYHTLTKKEFPRRDPDFFGPNQRAGRMWALLMRCWDHDPTVRPIAREVTVSLRTLVRETEPGDMVPESQHNIH